MTLALIDIGNTTLKWCKLETLDNVHHLPTESLGLENSRKVLVIQLLSSGIKQISLCSVAREELTQPLIQDFEKAGFSIQRVHSKKKYEGRFKLINRYQEPKALGADRWYSAIGAITTRPQRDLIVVNFGTATVIDSILYKSENSYEFLGGRILPGVEMMKKAFIEKLGHITDLFDERTAIKQETDFPVNTVQAITTGLLESQLGAITLVENKMRSLGFKPVLIISGGWASTFRPMLEIYFPETCFVVNTVLTGLAAVERKN